MVLLQKKTKTKQNKQKSSLERLAAESNKAQYMLHPMTLSSKKELCIFNRKMS